MATMMAANVSMSGFFMAMEDLESVEWAVSAPPTTRHRPYLFTLIYGEMNVEPLSLIFAKPFTLKRRESFLGLADASRTMIQSKVSCSSWSQ